MRFFAILTPVLLSGLAALAAAGSTSNPIMFPYSSTTLYAGEVITIKWTPTTPGTVSLQLRSGPFNDLDTGIPIASGLENSGSYRWTIPASTKYSAYYTIEIISSSDESDPNYSAPFAIQSNKMAHSLSKASKTLGMTRTKSMAMKTPKPTMTSHKIKKVKPSFTHVKLNSPTPMEHVHIPTGGAEMMEVRGGMVAAVVLAALFGGAMFVL